MTTARPQLATTTPEAPAPRRPSAIGRLLERIVTIGAMLWTGVMAGYFLAFSVQVMPGLDGLSRVETLAALPVMGSINDRADDPRFAVAFLGAMGLAALATAIAAIRRDGIASWLTIAGGAVFLLGAVGVTLIFNGPLDDDLSGWSVTDPASIGLMEGYVRDWSRWNDVRLVASLIAFGLFAVAGMFGWRASTAPAASTPEMGDGGPTRPHSGGSPDESAAPRQRTNPSRPAAAAPVDDDEDPEWLRGV